MSSIYKIIFLLAYIGQASAEEVVLSKDIFRKVPYSSQYSEDGALIRSVDFRSVNDLIPQIEEKFEVLLKKQKLEDRNEAHITVITPPEGKTGFFPGSIGIDKVLPTSEMINTYKGVLQDTSFSVVCLGMRSNDKGRIVFYLVVESDDILNIRKEISELVGSRGSKASFEPVSGYYPHITIGFVNGDVHGVSKGPKTCVADVVIK